MNKHKQSLNQAADQDKTGFDWQNIDITDPQVMRLIEFDHAKGITHPGLACCTREV